MGQRLKKLMESVSGVSYRDFISKKTDISIAIAARSYYRLYVNGKLYANGPARTAKNYCRVDVIHIEAEGCIHIAAEVAALDKPEKYCNDCTLEPGLFIAEVTANGNVLSATGDDSWRYFEILYRKSLVEPMSHSRGIIESYDLDTSSYNWLIGVGENRKVPQNTGYNITFLNRRAPYPTYQEIEMETLLRVNDVIAGEKAESGLVTMISRYINAQWYAMLNPKDCFIDQLNAEKEAHFSGQLKQYTDASTGKRMIDIMPGNFPAALFLGMGESELGFISFHIHIEEPCTLDLINSDHLNTGGTIKTNSYVTRYALKKGSYQLTTFEPKLIRYLKMIFRTSGKVTISMPVILDYSYPDDRHNHFSCNDGELNMIYEASRKTLRLNTLDIFMDCPQRERGGWLCDSHFTAHGAWQMFGDLSVEKDFIENFMLTDPDQYRNAFFPDVYPGTKTDSSDPGIENWSFWLLTELYDYYKRSGDKEFMKQCRPRVTRFVEGLLALRGESGLIENMNSQFVDWSLSNKSFCLEPISIPNNCLAVHMLEKMAELYEEPEWFCQAKNMREILVSIDYGSAFFGNNGDAATYVNGILKLGECQTESGTALQLWSGFHRDEVSYVRNFVNCMGTCPKNRADPNIGKANLFIGLMIRYDVLSQMGKVDTLVHELKDVYLPEIIHGSGTLFENYAANSGCHGFNALAGALLTNDVLGLGQPEQLTKTVKISPHPGNLKWASGSAKCSDGDIYMNWAADEEMHILDIDLSLPEGWKANVNIPFELVGWKVLINGVLVNEN